MAIVILCLASALSCRSTSSMSAGDPGLIWGPLDKAQKAHAEYFAPGLAHKTLINGQPAYVVCAMAEADFEEEVDADLMREVVGQAKLLLLDYLADGKPGEQEMELRQFTNIYAWREGRRYFGVYYVLMSNVKLSAKKASLVH